MLSKTLALAIAIVLFVELLRDKRPRYLVSLCAGCWMLVLLLLTHPPAVLEALSLHSFLTPRFWFAHGGVTELNVGINWSTMFFLTGMMVLVEGMGEAGFFDWVSLRLARALGFRPMAILLSFMILAALLAMFVDSVTVILFLVAATVRLAQYLRFDPVPLIIGEIFAANLGGAATMTGDPPNIILGTSLGLSFWDFLQNNGIICLAGLGLALVYFYVCFHNKLKRREKGVAPELWEIDPGDAIPNHRIFRVRVGLFAAVVLLIATHTLTGLTMPSIGILAAGATLCTTKYPWGLLKQVEWKTLGFLVGLFLTVSGLEQTGRGPPGPDGGGADLVRCHRLGLRGQRAHGGGDGAGPAFSGGHPGDGPANADLDCLQGDGHRRHRHPHRGLGQRYRRGRGGAGGSAHRLEAVL